MPCICTLLCSSDYIFAFAQGARGGITAVRRWSSCESRYIFRCTFYCKSCAD
jgi:hypothetical protein